MKSVKVIFENPAHNYTTAVNPKTTDEQNRRYFVGQCFNVASYPGENMQKCVDIQIN